MLRSVPDAMLALRRGGILVQVGISSGGNANDVGRLVSKERQLRGSFREACAGLPPPHQSRTEPSMRRATGR